MELRLYDTLTKEKRPLVPLDPANVRMYACRIPAPQPHRQLVRPGQGRRSVLRVDQRRQEIEGCFSKATKVLRFTGLLEGTRVKAAGGRLELEQLGDTLRVAVAKGNYAAYRGATYAKSCCGTCP